jgi:transposase InsO family protein
VKLTIIFFKEKKMDQEQAKKVALFRYGVIAPVLNDDQKCREKHFKEMSQLKLSVPGVEVKKNYSISSFKEWFHRYKNGGLDALYPSIRSDKGHSKKISDIIHTEITKRIEDYPYLSASGIYRMLVKENKITKNDFTENTLRNYIRINQLKDPSKEIVGRKKFESPAINILWISDFMHCYPVADPESKNKKKKTYLCAIIDDHSRLIVGANFFYNENSFALGATFKNAILQYGLPGKFYCDNGAVFSTHYLQEACARTGVALIHSKPYDSPSRGKIERFFRSIRQMFLPVVDFKNLKSIDELNKTFQKWLEDEYHLKSHNGIKDLPRNKYQTSLSHSKIRRLSEEELNLAFYKGYIRKVKNDSTVSINGKLYEVPPEYIKEKHEFRSPLDRPMELSLFINGKPICQIRSVNLIENFEKPHTNIHFNDTLKNED